MMSSNFLTRKKILLKIFILIAFFYSFFKIFNLHNPYTSYAINGYISFKEMLNLFLKNEILKQQIISIIIKNTIILIPVLISMIKRNYYFFITYLSSFILSVNLIKFFNNTSCNYDVFFVLSLIGSLSVFKLIGSTVLSNFILIPFLYGFAVQILQIQDNNIIQFIINIIISVCCFLFCFKIENIFKKRKFDEKINFRKTYRKNPRRR